VCACMCVCVCVYVCVCVKDLEGECMHVSSHRPLASQRRLKCAKVSRQPFMSLRVSAGGGGWGGVGWGGQGEGDETQTYIFYLTHTQSAYNDKKAKGIQAGAQRVLCGAGQAAAEAHGNECCVCEVMDAHGRCACEAHQLQRWGAIYNGF
jgi:hypothetical protein